MSSAGPSAPLDAQVLVVGAGPVGMTLAMDLGRRGVRVQVLEQQRQTTTNPRCNTTNARSMEYFRLLGVADEVRRAGLPLNDPSDVVYCTSLTGWELARFRFSSSADILSGDAPEFTEWPTPEPQHRVSQIFLEPILERHLRTFDTVRLDRGWRVESVRQDGDSAYAVAREVDTGVEREIRAAYVVGCDGGSSVVRRYAGARLEGDAEVAERRHSIYFRSAELGGLFGERPGWMYWWYGPTFRGTLIRLSTDGRYLCHARVPNGMDRDEVDSDEVLRAAIGRPLEHEKLDVIKWTARRLVADKLREGRILLAGDAGHLWLPIGGFGMNTGIADAMGLSWRLAAILAGWAGERTLDDYQLERRSVGEATSRAALKLDTDMFHIGRDPELHRDTAEGARLRREAGERIEQIDRKQWYSQGVQLGARYVGSPGTAPGVPVSSRAAIERIGEYEPSVAPGVRFPHVWRADGTSVFDQLGRDWTLVRVGSDAPGVEELVAAAGEYGIGLTVLDVTEPGARSVYAARLVLVRPDLHVAWSGDALPGESAALLRSLLGLPVQPTAVATGVGAVSHDEN